MDPVMIFLRVLHVIAGIYMAGSYLFLVPILEPKLKRLGPPIQSPVMRSLMPTLLPVNGISFIILIGTGVAMTLIMRSGTLNSLLVTGWGWMMFIGLITTVAAAIIGFGVLAPTGMRIEKIGRSMEGRAPKPEESQQLGRLSARGDTLSRVNFVLIMVAVATMIASRYV